MDEIVEAVKGLTKECFEQGEEEIPLLISENDICCGFVERLKKLVSYRVTTEFCLGNRKRNDVTVFSSELEKENYANKEAGVPYSFFISRPIALIELKLNWYKPKHTVLQELKKDIEYLEDFTSENFEYLDENPKFKYMVYFDYQGTLCQDEISSLSNKETFVVYVDIKHKKIIQS